MKELDNIFIKASMIEMPYIIAEIGVNHEGSMIKAKKLIELAKEGGADAVKFQTYKAETLASVNSPAYWDTTKEKTKSQFELFKKHDSFWKNEMVELKKFSDQLEIEFMSTPFDLESADFLNEIVNVFKISSSDITNKPFIEKISQYGKPIILSTGASTIYEIQSAVDWIKRCGDNKLALLHCVLNYPTDDANANLGVIRDLMRHFPELQIGYSDHTLPRNMRILEIASLFGAKIIEKHFTDDKTQVGNDHYHAMDYLDLKKFRKNFDEILNAVGKNEVGYIPTEEKSRLYARRSLVANRKIIKGSLIKLEDLTFKRPGTGISPSEIDSVIGKTALKEINYDDIIFASDIE